LNPNPIRKVLSLIQTNGVRSLLMGGQACVFYGAAEFSRDIDLVLLVEDANLRQFQSLLTDVQANRSRCRRLKRSTCGGATPFTSAATTLRQATFVWT
jgi:hypothetical protein